MGNPIVATRKSEQSVALIDPWTAVHGGTGLAAGLLGVPMTWALGVAIAYEGIEYLTQRSPEGRNMWNVSKPERFGNQVVDVLVFAGGVYLGHKYNQTG